MKLLHRHDLVCQQAVELVTRTINAADRARGMSRGRPGAGVAVMLH
jgi:hypothetical protein